MNNARLLWLLLCALPLLANAQQLNDTTRHQLSLLATADVYYAAFNTDLPENGLAPFNTVGPRDNTISLNVAQVGLSHTGPKTRANFTYQIGDIPLVAWSPEFPNVQAANAGFLVAGDWWVDAGFFSTHIGYESFLPRQKYLSSAAYISFNEPFYQAGVRASGSFTDKLSAQVWLLNGYNIFVDNNAGKSVGIRLNYQYGERGSLTYNNLLGKEQPDDQATQFRQTHNLFISQKFADRLTVVANVTVAHQTNTGRRATSEDATMHGAFLTLSYAINERFSLAGRAEYFSDEQGYISGPVPGVGFDPDTDDFPQTGVALAAGSLSAEYRPTPDAYLRAETRFTRQGDDMRLFVDGSTRRDYQTALLLTAGVSFGRDVLW